MNKLPDLAALKNRGFQVEFHSHAQAILAVDFPEVLGELEDALGDLTIPIEEIIGSGGGEAKGTQRLRRSLASARWRKVRFEISKTVNGKLRESISHEVDHVRTLADDRVVALEIEWNNKDPFFDRDLENFKRLHAEGAISVGVIVTRGATLQAKMGELVARFVEEHKISGFESLLPFGYEPTTKQRAAINGRTTRKRNPIKFQDAFCEKFVSDKFGKATTHWEKLQERVRRRVGNPCPLLLIGLPAEVVTFNETAAALAEIKADNQAAEELEEE